MITREADYSIRAILFLSREWPDGFPIPASVLAEEMNIPYRFLRRIIRKIANAGFVICERGRTGGVRLAKAPADISLLDILQAVDLRAVTLNCCLEDPGTCERQPICPVHHEMRSLQNILENELGSLRFDRLAKGEGRR